MDAGVKDMQAVILCGGRGTRLREVTEILPKPMVSVGQYPIVFHIMKWYAKFGVRRFVLCLGYKKESFISYFTNFANNVQDVTVMLKDNAVIRHGNETPDWEVTLVDTELDSFTGRRLNIASKYVTGDSFFLTYGDGLSDVDILKMHADHIESGKSITLTSVKVPLRFGLIEFDTSSANAQHEAAILKLNTGRAENALGWKPVWGIDTALLKTFDWYLAYVEVGAGNMMDRQIEEYCSDASRVFSL